MKIIDGKMKISASDIVNYFYPMDENIPLEVLELAGKRGSAVHKLIELNLEDKEADINDYFFDFEEKDFDKINLQYNAFLEFLKEENQFLSKQMDTEIFIETDKFRGIIDYLDQDKIIDWKTNAVFGEKEIEKATLQMNFYNYFTGNGKEMYVLHLKKNKTRNFYKLIEIELIEAVILEDKFNEAYEYYSKKLIENWYEKE